VPSQWKSQKFDPPLLPHFSANLSDLLGFMLELGLGLGLWLVYLIELHDER